MTLHKQIYLHVRAHTHTHAHTHAHTHTQTHTPPPIRATPLFLFFLLPLLTGSLFHQLPQLPALLHIQALLDMDQLLRQLRGSSRGRGGGRGSGRGGGSRLRAAAAWL